MAVNNKKAKANMDRAEKYNIFALADKSKNFTTIQNESGMDHAIKCSNGNIWFFDSDLNLDDFYNTYLPYLRQEIEMIEDFESKYRYLR